MSSCPWPGAARSRVLAADDPPPHSSQPVALPLARAANMAPAAPGRSARRLGRPLRGMAVCNARTNSMRALRQARHARVREPHRATQMRTLLRPRGRTQGRRRAIQSGARRLNRPHDNRIRRQHERHASGRLYRDLGATTSGHNPRLADDAAHAVADAHEVAVAEQVDLGAGITGDEVARRRGADVGDPGPGGAVRSVHAGSIRYRQTNVMACVKAARNTRALPPASSIQGRACLASGGAGHRTRPASRCDDTSPI